MAGLLRARGDEVWEGVSPEFSSKKCRVLCIFIVKNYMWPATGTGGLNRSPLGAEDVKRTPHGG